MFGIPPMSPHLAAEVGVRERETGSRMENRRSERGRRGKLYFTFFCRWRDPLRKNRQSLGGPLTSLSKRERERGGEGRGEGEGGDRRWLE